MQLQKGLSKFRYRVFVIYNSVPLPASQIAHQKKQRRDVVVIKNYAESECLHVRVIHSISRAKTGLPALLAPPQHPCTGQLSSLQTRLE